MSVNAESESATTMETNETTEETKQVAQPESMEVDPPEENKTQEDEEQSQVQTQNLTQPTDEEMKDSQEDDDNSMEDEDEEADGDGTYNFTMEEVDESQFDRTLAGFQSIQDTHFTCDSDYSTLVRQMVSDIPLQRLVSTKQLVPSAPRFGAQAMKSLITKIKDIANDKEIVIRQTLAAQLGGLAEYFKESLPQREAHHIIINELLPCIQRMLLDNVEVRQSASKSLVQIAKLLPPNSVHEHVLRIVLHLAHDEMDEHKITALPLLGDLAPVVGERICSNYLASDLHALSQDNSFRVRKATVQVFGSVCAEMGPENTERQMVLSLYQSLATDNIWSVRKGCVESIVDLSKAVNPETRVRLVEIMEQFLKDTSRWVRNTAYEFLGPFIATLSSDQITPEFLRSFTNIPKLKSAEADTESCNHCAYNFPAVVYTVGAERWEELREAYNLLLKKTFKSRKTLACSLHEIAKILGTDLTEQDLLPAFELFHKDIDDIREGVLKHFADFLEVMSPRKREEHLATLWEISSEMDANWRFRLLLASQLKKIMELYSADTVSEQIIPLAFQLCDDKMSDVRYEAIQSIAHFVQFMKENGTEQQYQDTVQKTVALAKNRTYAKRQLYVKCCGIAIEVLEPATFEENLLPALVELQRDPVANVRFVLAKIVKRCIVGHEYFSQLPQVVSLINFLRDDPEDVEVVRFFRTEEEVQNYSSSVKPASIRTDDIESETSDDGGAEGPPNTGTIKSTPENVTEEVTTETSPSPTTETETSNNMEEENAPMMETETNIETTEETTPPETTQERLD